MKKTTKRTTKRMKQMEDEVVNVKVFIDKTVVVFEGKVSTDVTPDELTHLGCLRERGSFRLRNKATNENVMSFKGMQSVELTVCYGRAFFAGVLYRCGDGVLRKSKAVPPLECVMMSVWYMSHEECEKVFKCETLEHLEVNLCKLTQIPKDIGKMKKLKTLRLEGFEDFRSIPEEIGELSCLKELWIENYLIDSLPKSIGRLSQLEKLHLRYLREVTRIPESIGQLSNLKVLHICDCGIYSLPTSIVGLRQLEKMYLVNLEYLKSLPEEIGMLECLKELSIGSCGIETLPESIGRLKQLKMLDLEFLEELKSIPESVGQLSNLKELWLFECEVESLPKSIGGLRQLEALQVSLLKSIPEELCCLSNLRQLRIENCKIERLPRNMKGLKLLTSVRLNCSDHLRFDPEDVLAFSRLKKLSVSSCSDFLMENGVNAFCQMLRMSVNLHEFEFEFQENEEDDAMSEDEQEMLDDAVKENGSITKGICEFTADFDDICARNRANHARAMSSVVCMMAIRRCRSALNGVPREMIQMLGKMLWTTRCDVEAWKVKE